MDIKKLIERGETQSVEFEESLGLKDEIGETVSAFSNSDGGTVIVGVSDSGVVLGVGIGKNTLEELANYIKRNTDPRIFPSVRIQEMDVKKVVMIAVEESPEKPVFFKNRAYKRVGATNQQISASELRKLAKESGERIYWDERVCEDASLADIEEERFVLQSQLRTARFAGKTLTRDFLDRLDCSGALWEMVEGSEGFVRKSIRLFGFRTEYSFQRIDKLEYPIKAIREAIINALIHRNYIEPADTRVAIFDDRIEIISPGSFPEGVTPDKPKHVPVNPILCQLMYDVGFIEKYGSGIYMIISRNTVTNDLSNLVEKGLIKRVGRGRGSYYAPKI